MRKQMLQILLAVGLGCLLLGLPVRAEVFDPALLLVGGVRMEKGRYLPTGGTATAIGGKAALSYGLDGGSITVEDGCIQAAAGTAAVESNGVFATHLFRQTGGSVTAEGGKSEAKSFGVAVMEEKPDFRFAGGEILLSGGSLTARSKGQAFSAVPTLSDGGSRTIRVGTAEPADLWDGAAPLHLFPCVWMQVS